MGRFVNFNEGAYKADLLGALGNAMDKVNKSVYKSIVHNLAGLKIRNADAKYAKDFPRAIKITTNKTMGRISTKVSMSNDKPNNSFRALYYEYGTGKFMKPPAKWSPFSDYTWNPVRPMKSGASFYYRDRPWYDLGGNYHRRGGVKKGVKKRIPENNKYGQPIQAENWFRNGILEGTSNMDALILSAVKSVPISSYIKLRDIRVRM